MKKKWFVLLMAAALVLLAACGPKNEPAEENDGNYYVGDAISTAFFTYTINSAEAAESYGDYTPADGNKLIVVDITIQNTETYSMPMFDTDFQIQWGDGDDDWDFPLEQFSDDQLPEEYEIGIGRQTQGLLIYEVPADSKDYALGFMEYYEDGTEGDVYFTYFTA